MNVTIATDSPEEAAAPRRPTGLDAHAVQEWLTSPEGPRLLDVRSPAEFTTAHIPGSYNVPLDLLREHRTELRTHLGDEVVLVCRSGARAGQAESLLGATGLDNVHVLTGGVTAWEAAGGPLTRGTETWELERQVRLVAGSIVLAGVLASTVAPWAKWISAGVGAGLTGAALTNSCAMGMLLSRLPYNRRNEPDLGAVLRTLAA
ncbi:rhodanese-like domain-containing protein [Knoellia aerolata]|uniref:Sulfurtransferase n=1 Tax=Knoellia aerolata DSM 18566 TaxID=1385519 RepID=A0A0A0K142_9MICO|nr:rhodanese-like domain-containing protein [Knoellia aerolata]KGN42012.1 sulfurtransferase [Knoellia aerolata DSM 18566]